MLVLSYHDRLDNWLSNTVRHGEQGDLGLGNSSCSTLAEQENCYLIP